MNKLWLLFLIYVICLLTIVGKLFYIQIFAADKFAFNNYLQTQKINPERGNIYDSESQPLAFNQVTYLLYAEPAKIDDKKKTIEKIDEILKIGEATLESRIRQDKQWVSVARGLAKAKKDKIAKLKLKGLGFDEEEGRFYPEGSSAAHILGFVGKDKDNNNIGYFGAEGYYEKDLAGLPGIIKTERDVLGNPIFIGVQDKLPGADGRDLILTLDKTVQQIVKKRLMEGIKRYKAKEGCAIVANPSTMEILALSCLPDFDPGNYQNFPQENFRNPAISTLYEPGSIFKPIIVASALNENKVKLSDTYNEVGPVRIYGSEIQTWNKKYEGEISVVRILEKSSNVGMVYVGDKLGSKLMLEYLDKFGLGQETGIDLQGEVSGHLKPQPEWRPIDYATATFGQGVVVTPMQMIRAFSAVINGGYLMRPFVVSEIQSGENDKKKINPKKQRRILSEKTSLLMRKALEKTVENAEAKWARPKGYKIGGKTGTAQIPIAGSYDPSKTIASFIGFAPTDDPLFIVLISLREPSTSPWGSETAAPIFFEVAKDLIVYYNILPE